MYLVNTCTFVYTYSRYTRILGKSNRGRHKHNRIRAAVNILHYTIQEKGEEGEG